MGLFACVWWIVGRLCESRSACRVCVVGLLGVSSLVTIYCDNLRGESLPRDLCWFVVTFKASILIHLSLIHI